MKNKNYRTVGTIPKYNRKIVEKGRLGTPNTPIHTRSLWHGTGTSRKPAGVKQIILS